MSTRNGTGPTCPKPQRLRELQDFAYEEQSRLDDSDKYNIRNYADIVDALEWLANMLDNRNTYHKKRQIKTKVMFELAREKGLL